MFTIYKYTCPDKRNYIGITMYPEVRKKQHKQKEYLFCNITDFAVAIRKYGYDNFTYSIIEVVYTLEEACEREIHWIKFFDSVASGYNLQAGGSVPRNITHDDRVIGDIQYLLKESNHTLQKIATMFKVSLSYVSQIKNGKMRGNVKTERVSQFRKGSTVPNAKLSEELTKEIREKLELGVSRRQIRLDYKISKTLVQLIATNQIWTHVEANYTYKKKETNGNAVLDRECVSKLKQDIKTGALSRAELAAKYGISIPTIDQIKAGKTWKDVA